MSNVLSATQYKALKGIAGSGEELLITIINNERREDYAIVHCFMQINGQGAQDIKNAPKRIRAAGKMIEKMGGKLTGFYLTIGDYDYIAIGEAPNDEVACTFLLGMGATGILKDNDIKGIYIRRV